MYQMSIVKMVIINHASNAGRTSHNQNGGGHYKKHEFKRLKHY